MFIFITVNMLKFQFCGNISQKCLTGTLFHPKKVFSNNLKQVSLFSSKPLPVNEFVPHKRYNFRDNQGFSKPNFVSLNKNSWGTDEKSWGDQIELPEREFEQDISVILKNDPDTFGGPLEKEIVDEGDIREEKFFTERVEAHKKLSTKQYADIIKKYIKERKIKDAIDVLEVKMLQEDKVKPEAYIYNLLLGACGRVGYTKKAFMLYNQMKKRGFKAMGGTYTALFNACANSPWPLTDGLSRARHLYEIMIDKGDRPNETTYNAMIKAFGRCGDLPMSFTLVDEMVQKEFVLKDDTINFLLQACITDEEAGFRHSLLVWRKLVEKNVAPSVYTFNLLLRCVRDCELGDLETTQDVIAKLVGEGDRFTALPQTHQILQLEAGDTEENLEISDNSVVVNLVETMNQRPNLLAPKPNLGNVLSLSEVKKPEDRLLLLGGCQGFLETMSTYKCTPDIKTFTLLLDSIPSTNAAEKQLMVAMKKLNIQPDIDFYNMLIKRKSMRCDYEGAKELLISMKQMKFRPDLITYGVLAMSCKTKEEALELVKEMKKALYRINSVILGSMLQQACYHMDFGYIFEIMELCLREQVAVNKKFLEHLEEFTKKCRDRLAAKQLHKRQEKLFGIFRARYKTWLTEVQIDDSEDAHPWQQYRQNYPEDKPIKYKIKDTARFKAKHTSLFKVKTSQKHKKR